MVYKIRTKRAGLSQTRKRHGKKLCGNVKRAFFLCLEDHPEDDEVVYLRIRTPLFDG